MILEKCLFFVVFRPKIRKMVPNTRFFKFFEKLIHSTFLDFLHKVTLSCRLKGVPKIQTQPSITEGLYSSKLKSLTFNNLKVLYLYSYTSLNHHKS